MRGYDCRIEGCTRQRMYMDPHCAAHADAERCDFGGCGRLIPAGYVFCVEHLSRVANAAHAEVRDSPLAAMFPDVQPASRGVCEAKVKAILESLTDDELAYLYAIALYEGRGLRYDACVARLRRAGWR